MAALTKDRNTVQKDSPLNGRQSYTCKASKTFYKGALCVMLVNESGQIQPGEALTGSIGAGVSTKNFTSVSGDTMTLDTGVFYFNNSSSSDEISADDVGKLCYVVDDNTVALTSNSGARSIAGRVQEVLSGPSNIPGFGSSASAVAVLVDCRLIASGTTI